MKKWHFPVFYGYDEAISHETWEWEIFEEVIFKTYLAAKKWCRAVDPEEIADCSDFHDRTRHVVKHNPNRYFHAKNSCCYLVRTVQHPGYLDLHPSTYQTREIKRAKKPCRVGGNRLQ